MENNEASTDQFSRGLKNRHVQLIALGGTIGPGSSWAPANRFIQQGHQLCSRT